MRSNIRAPRSSIALTASVVALLVCAGGALPPQTSPLQNTGRDSSPAPQAHTKPIKLGVPPVQNLFIMIRTMLIALQQANVTGNYSVLRDLGAPDFAEANSVERLASAFSELRSQGGNIAPVVLLTPTLARPAAIDGNGMLRLTGSFETKPNALDFDLLFQAVDGIWRLYGIAVQFQPAHASQAVELAAPASKNAAPPLKGQTSSKNK